MGYEFTLRHIPNAYSLKNEYLQKEAPKIETLILGSSHSFKGVNPAFFDRSTFNLAMVSQPLYYDYRLLEKYRRDLPHLKTIILPISYFSLYSGKFDSGEEEAWRKKNYEIYYQIHDSKAITDRFEIFNTENKIGLKRILRFYFKKDFERDCDRKGWQGKDNSKVTHEDIIQSGYIAANRHSENLYSEKTRQLLKNNLDYLNKLIVWAKEHDIRVILFLPPACPEYKDHLNPEQLKETIEYSEAFAQKYRNCYFYNFLNDPDFQESDFFDADHLAVNGAKKLSLKLNQLVQELTQSGRPSP